MSEFRPPTERTIPDPHRRGRFARGMARRAAIAVGAFWLPCPLCGEPCGGHEWGDVDGKSSVIYRDPERPTVGTGICPFCTIEGRGETIDWTDRRTTQ